jgi:hypothetical protein
MYKECIECGDRKYYAEGNKWVDITEKDIMDKVAKFNSEYVLQ